VAFQAAMLNKTHTHIGIIFTMYDLFATDDPVKLPTRQNISAYQYGKWEELILKIPDESIDLLYTDPPYGMNYLSNIPGSSNWNKNPETSTKFEKPILNDNKCDIDWKSFAYQAYRVLKPNSFFILHCNIEFIGRNFWTFNNDSECEQILDEQYEEKANFKYKGTIAWAKKFAIGGDLKGAMKRDWEPILYFAKGKPIFRPIFVRRDGIMSERKRISEIDDWTFQLKSTDKTGFPTQKPRDLCKQIIELTTDKDNTVLDPFSGSGTISSCATEIGRTGVSFEADKEVYEKFNKNFAYS